VDERAQLLVRDALIAEQEALFVGVTGVVEDQLTPDSAVRIGPQHPVDGREAVLDGPAAAVGDEDQIARRDAPQALQHARHGVRVAGRVA
jgi:hypothetical protein